MFHVPHFTFYYISMTELTQQQRALLDTWIQQCRACIEVEHDTDAGLYDARIPALDHALGFRSVKPTRTEAVNGLIELFTHSATESLLLGQELPEFTPHATVDYNLCC